MQARGLLLSEKVNTQYGDQIDDLAIQAGVLLKRYVVGDDFKAHDNIHAAFFSRDLYEGSTLSHPAELSDRFFKIVDAAPYLQWLHVCTTGTDLHQYAPTIQRGLTITASGGVTALPIAQSVLAAVLAQSRGFVHWLNAQARRCWNPLSLAEAPKPIEEQRAVIIGAGSIGTEIARLLKCVGFKTMAVRKDPQKKSAYFQQTYSLESLDALLPECDWLILAAPLTLETEGLVNASRIALLPRGARVVNISRGGLIVEAALIRALESGHIAGAFLDTFEIEPLPQSSPLWHLPGVWISPHNCAASQGHEAKVVEAFLDHLPSYLRNIARTEHG